MKWNRDRLEERRREGQRDRECVCERERKSFYEYVHSRAFEPMCNAIMSPSNGLPFIMNNNEYVDYIRNDFHISIPHFI